MPGSLQRKLEQLPWIGPPDIQRLREPPAWLGADRAAARRPR